MEKLIITAAICGAEVTKKHNPMSARTTAPPPRTVSGSAWCWTPSRRPAPA